MYQELIDVFIQCRNDARQELRGSDKGEWHPSGLTDCPRKAVYDYLGTPPSNDKDIRNIRIMDRGTEMHQFIQDITVEAIPGTLTEVKIDFRGIKGSCDALVPVDEDVPSGTVYYELQEYKSISGQGKRYMNGRAKPEHIKQARIYYACLVEMGYALDGIRLVYMDRDDWSIDEYEVEPWTEAEVDAFFDEVTELESHVVDGTLPERMPLDSKGKKYWLCRYCEYATKCWEVDD